MNPPVNPGGADGIAWELAGLPGIVARLLALHVPDAHGRCRACTTGGTGVPGAAWPCGLHFYATAAQEIHREQRPVERAS
ncbi:MAG: hypothetical protein AB7V42_16705 [Thermoleophilia bacterium]